MAKGMLVGMLVGGLVIIAGCDDGRSIAATFRTQTSVYNEGETIQAVFVNREVVTVYIPWVGCLPVQLERQAEGAWTRVSLNVICTAEARPPLSIRPGTSYEVKIAGRILADADVDAGTYRLVLRVARSEGKAARRVVSNAFAVQ